MISRRNFRRSRKNIKSRKGGLFWSKALKIEWDNKNNCYATYKGNAKQIRDYCTPAYLERYDYHKDGRPKDLKQGPYKYNVPTQ